MRTTTTTTALLIASTTVTVSGFIVQPQRNYVSTTSSTSSSSTTALNGLFDGVKEAFSAPPSQVASERETPIDRWMGWSVVSENAAASNSAAPVGTWITKDIPLRQCFFCAVFVVEVLLFTKLTFCFSGFVSCVCFVVDGNICYYLLYEMEFL